jgi:hypothetical protein
VLFSYDGPQQIGRWLHVRLLHILYEARPCAFVQTLDNQLERPVVDSQTASRDDPMAAFGFQPRQISRDLEQVSEVDGGDLPSEYFARCCEMPMYSEILSPIDIPTAGQRRSPNHRGSTSSRQIPSFTIPTYTTSSSRTVTNRSTSASEMCCQSSLCNDIPLESFDMMNVDSSATVFIVGSGKQHILLSSISSSYDLALLY